MKLKNIPTFAKNAFFHGDPHLGEGLSTGRTSVWSVFSTPARVGCHPSGGRPAFSLPACCRELNRRRLSFAPPRSAVSRNSESARPMPHSVGRVSRPASGRGTHTPLLDDPRLRRCVSDPSHVFSAGVVAGCIFAAAVFLMFILIMEAAK